MLLRSAISHSLICSTSISISALLFLMSSTEPFINSGRKRIYSLESFIRFFILQKIIGIDTDSAMLRTLSLSKELRDFCGFVKVPDASKITLFKQQFCDHLADFFHRLVDITEPICRELDDKAAHPDIVEAKTDNPDIDKEISDSTALKPVLSNFFKLHPDLAFKTFIGDSAFDSYDNYSALKNDFHFERACIPINIRNSKRFDNNNGSAGQKPRPVSFDKNGIPLCPLDGSPFISLGKSKGAHRSTRFKFVCPKSKPNGRSRTCTCPTPCTDSSYGSWQPDKAFSCTF